MGILECGGGPGISELGGHFEGWELRDDRKQQRRRDDSLLPPGGKSLDVDLPERLPIVAIKHPDSRDQIP